MHPEPPRGWRGGCVVVLGALARWPRLGRMGARAGAWKVAIVGWGALLLGIVSPLGGAFAIPAIVLAVAGLWWLRWNHEHDLAKGSLKFALLLGCLSLAAYALLAWWTSHLSGRSRRVHCYLNLNQIAKALVTYAEASDGRLPDATNWCDTLYPGVVPDGRVFLCPQFVKDEWQPYVFSIGGLELLLGGPALPRCTYGLNARVSRAKLKDLPQDVVLVFETRGGWNQHGGPADVIARHRGYTEVLFADTHSETCRLDHFAEWRWEP